MLPGQNGSVTRAGDRAGERGARSARRGESASDGAPAVSLSNFTLPASPSDLTPAAAAPGASGVGSADGVARVIDSRWTWTGGGGGEFYKASRRRIAWSDAAGADASKVVVEPLFRKGDPVQEGARLREGGRWGETVGQLSERSSQFCKALSFVKFRRGNLEGRDPRVDVGKKVLHARALLPDRLPFPRGSAR